MTQYRLRYTLRKLAEKLFIIILVGSYALMLSGCDPDFYISQTPQIEHFQSKSPEMIYREAVHALTNGSYNKAISYLRALIGLYPNAYQIESAQLKLLDCYVRQGQTKDALQKIDEFIASYPHSAHIESLKQRKAALQHKQRVNNLYYRDSKDSLGKKSTLVWNHIEKQNTKIRDLKKRANGFSINQL